MNKWIGSGFIGQDIVIKQTPTGVSIANTSLATSEKVKKGDNWEEETTWHNLVAFGYTANFMDKYLIKGSKILVEGKISNRSWDKPDGTKGYKSEIIVNSVEFAGGKKKDENQEEIKQKSINDNYDEISLEDIPF